MAKKLVRRDKDTYNGAIWLDSENQAYGVSYPRGTIVIVGDGAGGNNAYTLLEAVTASMTVANSQVSELGGGSSLIMATVEVPDAEEATQEHSQVVCPVPTDDSDSDDFFIIYNYDGDSFAVMWYDGSAEFPPTPGIESPFNNASYSIKIPCVIPSNASTGGTATEIKANLEANLDWQNFGITVSQETDPLPSTTLDFIVDIGGRVDDIESHDSTSSNMMHVEGVFDVSILVDGEEEVPAEVTNDMLVTAFGVTPLTQDFTGVCLLTGGIDVHLSVWYHIDTFYISQLYNINDGFFGIGVMGSTKMDTIETEGEVVEQPGLPTK